MQKITLLFPNHHSLWLFADKSRALNIAVTPRKNIIAGLFSSEEIDIAVKEFQAVRMDNAALHGTNASSNDHIGTNVPKSLFKFGFLQLIFLLNL